MRPTCEMIHFKDDSLGSCFRSNCPIYSDCGGALGNCQCTQAGRQSWALEHSASSSESGVATRALHDLSINQRSRLHAVKLPYDDDDDSKWTNCLD